jgi:hypothetical protein
MAGMGAHASPLGQAVQATMADVADQFLAASYDVLMSNVRKVHRDIGHSGIAFQVSTDGGSDDLQQQSF